MEKYRTSTDRKQAGQNAQTDRDIAQDKGFGAQSARTLASTLEIEASAKARLSAPKMPYQPVDRNVIDEANSITAERAAQAKAQRYL